VTRQVAQFAALWLGAAAMPMAYGQKEQIKITKEAAN
jgi:hypothetical protein